MVQPHSSILDQQELVPTSLLVVLDGIVQEPEHSYSTNNNGGQPQINFSETPDAAGRISIVYLGNEILTATSATSTTHIDEFDGDGSTRIYINKNTNRK